MKTKKRTRLISLFLAVVMAVSALTASLSAQAAYKPTYGEKATEEDFALMIEDVNTILNDMALTGDSIEAIYKVLPSLSAIVNNGSQNDSTAAAVFYANADPFFADLVTYAPEDGMIVADSTDESGAVVPGTFSLFFEDHPITCETQSDFAAELNKIIDLIIIPNVMQTLVMLPLFGMGEQATALAGGLDDICAALGIEQERTAADVLGFVTYQGDEAGTETYIKNIINAVLADNDAANNILDIIRTVVNDENFAKLYKGVKAVFANLNDVLTTLASSLGLDLGNVTEVINQINDILNRIPTTGEGDATMIDVNQLIPFICNEAGLGIVTSLIKFPEINLDNISGTETNADLVKTVYDYIYNTLIGDAGNNAKLKGVIQDPTGEGSILEGALGVSLPTEIEDALLAAFDMSNDDIANELIVVVAELAGRQIEEPSTEDPSENPSEDPTNPGTEDPSENPSEDPTKDDTTTTTAGGNKLPNANTGNPNLPNTGRTYDALTAVSMIICLSAAAALVVVLISSKKKVTE